jgi:hypothetical protein
VPLEPIFSKHKCKEVLDSMYDALFFNMANNVDENV